MVRRKSNGDSDGYSDLYSLKKDGDTPSDLLASSDSQQVMRYESYDH